IDARQQASLHNLRRTGGRPLRVTDKSCNLASTRPRYGDCTVHALMLKSNLRALERTPALIGAPADVLEDLAKHSHRRSVARRETLWKQGDPAERFSVLCHGIVKLVRYTPSGRRVICNLVGA